MAEETGKRFIGSIHGAASKFLASEQRGEGENIYASKNAQHMKAALEAEQHRVTADFLVRALHDLKGEGHDPEFVENMDRLIELWRQVRPRVSATS
ncbi:MAG TPA: hypothetical protein VII47_03880 [Actinomycetota bacterium]|jgi:hypothetical protein